MTCPADFACELCALTGAGCAADGKYTVGKDEHSAEGE
jgi:hypothetical protein